MSEAFVYCWTDHKNQKLYVGSHKGSLTDGYVCSSKLMLEEYNLRSQDFTRQIIAEGTESDIRKLESIILKSLNAASDNNFYNQHNGFGGTLTEEDKKKIGLKSRERWEKLSEEDKQNWIKKISKINKRPKTEKEKASMRGKRPHVNQSGSNNNNAKKITTPYGIFGSISEASKLLNIPYDNLWYKLRSNKSGWSRI